MAFGTDFPRRLYGLSLHASWKKIITMISHPVLFAFADTLAPAAGRHDTMERVVMTEGVQGQEPEEGEGEHRMNGSSRGVCHLVTYKSTDKLNAMA